MEKSKVLIEILVIFRHFGDVLSILYARRLRGYTATDTDAAKDIPNRKSRFPQKKNKKR